MFVVLGIIFGSGFGYLGFFGYDLWCFEMDIGCGVFEVFGFGFDFDVGMVVVCVNFVFVDVDGNFIDCCVGCILIEECVCFCEKFCGVFESWDG